MQVNGLCYFIVIRGALINRRALIFLDYTIFQKQRISIELVAESLTLDL